MNNSVSDVDMHHRLAYWCLVGSYNFVFWRPEAVDTFSPTWQWWGRTEGALKKGGRGREYHWPVVEFSFSQILSHRGGEEWTRCQTIQVRLHHLYYPVSFALSAALHHRFGSASEKVTSGHLRCLGQLRPPPVSALTAVAGFGAVFERFTGLMQHPVSWSFWRSSATFPPR